jgi:hypothetical protein
MKSRERESIVRLLSACDSTMNNLVVCLRQLAGIDDGFTEAWIGFRMTLSSAMEYLKQESVEEVDWVADPDDYTVGDKCEIGITEWIANQKGL